MESQKGKLTRTQSSLLRSPIVRSSVHSLSSVAAADDEEEEKPHRPYRRSPSRNLLLLPIPFALILFLFLYLRDDCPLFADVLLLSAFATAASLAARRADLFRRGATAVRRASSVEWSIGGVERKEKRSGGRIVREGVEFYSNGDYYEGEFHKGRCNGSGVYNFFGKGRYEGDWVDGKYDGYGTESWARGSRYRGHYRQGLRHGYGVYKFYSGDSYAGEWVGGQSHGVGAQTCSDGSSFFGEFKCGVKHGLGYYHFRQVFFSLKISFTTTTKNGDKYAGEYFADKIHGFGVYHFANGHCYEGSWHEGKKQGYGMYTFRNGDTRCGDWDAGILKMPLCASEPSVQHAVQAAQKAAESSILVPRVDSQVNKAVAAANRAATAARVAAIKAVQNRIDGKFCDINEAQKCNLVEERMTNHAVLAFAHGGGGDDNKIKIFDDSIYDNNELDEVGDDVLQVLNIENSLDRDTIEKKTMIYVALMNLIKWTSRTSESNWREGGRYDKSKTLNYDMAFPPILFRKNVLELKKERAMLLEDNGGKKDMVREA
ncbi:hypothetical protein ZIOFF_036760 [Zingiber officinale]|uniref:Uncharacterized protein n=1 Tax=Zingiber officinale TaxID=94328 RepID=A0A8J5GJ15_ZINOF|nr:hypothetical protein ZIOFF_036760 [Zingiber officinale]